MIENSPHRWVSTSTLQIAWAVVVTEPIGIDTKPRHGGGKPRAKILDEIADKYAFLIKELGVGQGK